MCSEILADCFELHANILPSRTVVEDCTSQSAEDRYFRYRAFDLVKYREILPPRFDADQNLYQNLIGRAQNSVGQSANCDTPANNVELYQQFR
jgi:hypothetical protein